MTHSENTPATKEQMFGYFSDIYKEVHGFRPGWVNIDSFSYDELGIKISNLEEIRVEQRKDEIESANLAASRMKELIQNIQDMGAGDKYTAIRWIIDSFNSPWYTPYDIAFMMGFSCSEYVSEFIYDAELSLKNKVSNEFTLQENPYEDIEDRFERILIPTTQY